jgi:hypothetical protein
VRAASRVTMVCVFMKMLVVRRSKRVYYGYCCACGVGLQRRAIMPLLELGDLPPKPGLGGRIPV